MADFKIFETKQFQEDLGQDFSGQKEKIKIKLLAYAYPQLRIQPYFGKNIKRLVNYSPPTWRYRIGNYRFFYEMSDEKRTVFMIAADIRADAY